MIYDDDIFTYVRQQEISKFNVVSESDALDRFPELSTYRTKIQRP